MQVYVAYLLQFGILAYGAFLLLKIAMAEHVLAETKINKTDNNENEHSLKKPKLSHIPERSTRTREEQFPSSIQGFKYHFNKDGQLRHLETDESFEFVVRKNDQKYNQRRYEALGEVITEHVYELLEKQAGLEKVFIPIDATEDEPQSFFFASKTKFKETDKVLLLIHGDGVVRAGQWARRLIINDGLDSGTQLPYIKKAKQDGFEVLVLNTNLNRAVGKNGKETLVRGSSTSKAHLLYVWDHFLKTSPVKSVAIVAHSYGGSSTLNLAMKREESFCQKAFFVALTDSVHQMDFQGASSSIREWFSKNSLNWVKSDHPLDTPVKSLSRGSSHVSAGTKKHEETSGKSINSVFRVLTERWKKRSSPVTGPREEL